MKMFNLNRKSNIVGRLIAGLLICVTFVLAMSVFWASFPVMEVKAADDSVGYVTAEWGQTKSINLVADSNGQIYAHFTLPTGAISTDVRLTNNGAGTIEVKDDGYIVKNIPYGSEATLNCTYMGGSDAEVIHIAVNFTRDNRSDEITVTASNRTFGEEGTSGLNAESWVSATSVSGRHPSLSFERDGSYWDATTTPMRPGNYVVSASLPESEGYTACTGTASFTVEKYTPTLTVPDGSAGTAPHPSVTYAAEDGQIVTVDSFPDNGSSLSLPSVAYKGENDSEYSFIAPTKPGTYSATLVLFSDSRLDDYNYEVTTSFKIATKEGKGKVTVADTIYGESSVKPKAESDTNDPDKAQFFYKIKNTDDSTFTKDLPTKPGKYVCKAVFPANDSYDECTAVCEFVIEKAKGVGTLTASDVYVGMEPKASPVSATNGVTAVTYQYKEKGASDSSYTDKLPTKPGEYTVKATFAATDYYLETSATANFKTSYMPAPTFGLTGKQGKNNFYTDTVSVKAPAGYEVSLSYGKDYKDSINILDGVKYVYFKDTKTGALSDKTAVPAYKMDSLLPVVKGVKNNDTIFKDEYELEITDDNLEMVKVNDQTVPVKDGKATYKLTSDSGEMLYKIEATDQAGHTVTYTITVASPWVEAGFVPAGQIVKLKPGKAYSLKSGKKYKIKGDDTVYNGGSKFYVDKEISLELEEVQ